MKDSFILYTKYKEQFKLLEFEEAGMLILALIDYVEGGTVPNFEGALKMAFSFIKSQLDKDRRKWEETCRKRAEAGKKGGEAKAGKAKQGKANVANAKFAKQNKQSLANQADNDSDCDSDYENDYYNDDDARAREYPPDMYDEKTAELSTKLDNFLSRLPSAMELETAFELFEKHGGEWLYRAFKESAERGARNLAYVRVKLEAWAANGGPDEPKPRGKPPDGKPQRHLDGRLPKESRNEYTKEQLYAALNNF